MSELVSGSTHPHCRAAVIVPVFNEEETIAQCLLALYNQSLPFHLYEVIVLLNNCTDASLQIASQFQIAHPEFALHLVERLLPAKDANVGTARRLLMDEASRRLPANGAILSTDGDSLVNHDWVEQNLKLLNGQADAVGGDIALHPTGFSKLSPSARSHYLADVRYLEAITCLESIFDPDPHDPWPRHHHHYGASLACTNSLYKRLGGLPQVDCLEDVAFVNAIVRADARLRHSPQVKVVTAARTSGKARIGLASQLREWESSQDDPLVDTAAFLKSYFVLRASLRNLWCQGSLTQSSNLHRTAELLGMDADLVRAACSTVSTFGMLHEKLDLRGRMWRRMKPDLRVGNRSRVTREMTALLRSLASEEHPAGTALPGYLPHGPTQAVQENSRVPDLPWQGSRGQTA